MQAKLAAAPPHGLADEVIEFQRRLAQVELDWVRGLLAREEES